MRRLICACAALALALTACGDRVIHTQREELEWELTEERAAVLADGTAVSLWNCNPPFVGWNSYRLPDGTELLEEQRPTGPMDVTVGGVEGFGQLGEAAQTAIAAYYEDQGLLYDLQTELERAYGAYRSCQDAGEEFRSYMAGQEVYPSASNDRVVCFVTNVTLSVQGEASIQGRVVEQEQLGAVFDRETGQPLDPMSLFTVPQEQAVQRLLDEAKIYSGNLRDEMQAAWDPAWLVLSGESLSVYFPRGSLPSQELAYSLSVDCQDIADVLQPWMCDR